MLTLPLLFDDSGVLLAAGLNNQITQIIKSSIAAAHRPHIEKVVGIRVVGHVAIVHAHEPGVVGSIDTGSTGPEEAVGLHF